MRENKTSREIMKNNEGYEGNILIAIHKSEDFGHLFHSLLIYMSHFILGKITVGKTLLTLNMIVLLYW